MRAGEQKYCEEAALVCPSGHVYSVQAGIARFKGVNVTYARRMQALEQLVAGHSDSLWQSRLAAQQFGSLSGLSLEALAGKQVLELGLHSGVFS